MPLLFCLSFQKKYLPDDHISNGLNNIHKHTTAQPTATRWKPPPILFLFHLPAQSYPFGMIRHNNTSISVSANRQHFSFGTFDELPTSQK